MGKALYPLHIDASVPRVQIPPSARWEGDINVKTYNQMAPGPCSQTVMVKWKTRVKNNYIGNSLVLKWSHKVRRVFSEIVRVSCSPGWPSTCSVARTGLELLIFPPPSLRVPGLQVCSNPPEPEGNLTFVWVRLRASELQISSLERGRGL